MSQEKCLHQTGRQGRANAGIALPSLCGEPQGKSVARQQIPTAGLSDYMVGCRNYLNAVLKQGNRIKLQYEVEHR